MANDGALVSALAEARERVKELERIEQAYFEVRDGSEVKQRAKHLARIGHLESALRRITRALRAVDLPETDEASSLEIGLAEKEANAALAGSVPVGWLTPAEADALQLEHDNKAIAWMAEVARLQTELARMKPVVEAAHELKDADKDGAALDDAEDEVEVTRTILRARNKLYAKLDAYRAGESS